jgi:hypothetical protein
LGGRHWGQALRRATFSPGDDDEGGNGGSSNNDGSSGGGGGSFLGSGLLSLLGLWSPGKGSEDRPPAGSPRPHAAPSAASAATAQLSPFSVLAAPPPASVARGLPGAGSIPYAAPETLGARVGLLGRRLALRCRSLRFLKRFLVVVAAALLLVPATWLGAPPPPPPPAPVLRPRDVAAEEAARDYAEFFSDGTPDPEHCIGTFPKEPAAPGTGRVYAAPSCTGGVGNQVSCAAAALAYSIEYNRCLLLAKIYPAADSAPRTNRAFPVPPEPPNKMRDVVFRHYWLQEQLLDDNQTSPFNNVAAEVQQPGLSMHYAPFRHPYRPDFWIAVLRGSFMHYQYTWELRKRVSSYLRPPPSVTAALLKKYPDLPRGVVIQVKRHNKEDHSDYTFPFIVRDFPLPSTHYYRQSLEHLLARAPRKDLAYFIFSNNDYEWARTIPWVQELPGPVIFADQEDEIDQMYMMMLARGGCICANQANCWWAAYLGVQPKPVFLPNHYYNAPGQEPMGIQYPGDVTMMHSDNARGEGPPPWFPRPWEFSPLAGLNEPTCVLRVCPPAHTPPHKCAHFFTSPYCENSTNAGRGARKTKRKIGPTSPPLAPQRGRGRSDIPSKTKSGIVFIARKPLTTTRAVELGSGAPKKSN